MIAYKGLLVHLALLGAATALAVHVWTRQDAPQSEKREQVEVWGGKPDDIKEISFESAERRVQLEPRKDSHGRWFVGTVDKTVEVRPPRPPPGDAGADAQPSAAPPPEKKRETSAFVSVGQGTKLAESLAPLFAFRAVGKIDDSRAEEFGLHKPEGTLRVKLDGKERSLVIGGTTPGGADRYARLDNGEVYAIAGSIAQNMMFAESRLVERELHGFEPEELRRARIVKGDQARELVRLEDKKDGWAAASSPGVLDETVGNWMTKLGRLRVMTYIETPSKPVGPEDLVVRVEYFDKGRQIGFLELVKLPPKELPAATGAEPAKPKAEYLVRSENTRWYAEVLASTAEQVEQDLASVLK
jgi:hypothetical protein